MTSFASFLDEYYEECFIDEFNEKSCPMRFMQVPFKVVLIF